VLVLRVLLRSLLPALLAGLLLTGCPVQSLHPIFDKQAPAHPLDQALLGAWQTEKGANDKPATLVIADDHSSSYLLKYTEEGKTTELRGALVQVGKQRLLDVWLESLDQFDVPVAGAMHLLPAHTFWKISLEGDALSCSYLSSEELEKRWKAHQATLAHTEVDNDRVVTAPPAELRAFLPAYAADPAVFSEPVVFHRQK
jgi:hypothetical protein